MTRVTLMDIERFVSADSRRHIITELVADPRVIEIADKTLLKHCEAYQISGLTGIEILPGETDQWLHTDDSIYPTNRRNGATNWRAMGVR